RGNSSLHRLRPGRLGNVRAKETARSRNKRDRGSREIAGTRGRAARNRDGCRRAEDINTSRVIASDERGARRRPRSQEALDRANTSPSAVRTECESNQSCREELEGAGSAADGT